MDGENRFNSVLGSSIRKLGSDYYVMKTSDRFASGVSDFIIFYQGRAVCLESKFIKNMPKKTGLVLNHAFSPTQIGFRNKIGAAGVPWYGIVGIDETRTIVVIEGNLIPPTGNWKKPDFMATMEKSATFRFNEVQAMVEHIFG